MANGQISPLLTKLSARHNSIFSFLDDKLRKYQWIITKLGMCVDIWISGLGLHMSKLRHFLTVIYRPHDNGGVLSYHVFYCLLILPSILFF